MAEIAKIADAIKNGTVEALTSKKNTEIYNISDQISLAAKDLHRDASPAIVAMHRKLQVNPYIPDFLLSQ